MATLRKRGHEKPADALDTQFGQLRDRLRFAGGEAEQGQTEQGQSESEGEPATGGEPAGSADPKDEAVRVPPEAAGAQAWFQPARAKLRAMAEAGAPPEQFRRFRTVNAAQLDALKREVRSWYAMLDKIILAGERAG
jgi:hypothetical protein